MLAEGYTIRETAERVGVTERTIGRWKQDIEFIVEVDRLSIMVGIAGRAERLRIAKRVVSQKIREDGTIKTAKDLLDWLRFAQSETDGVKLDLTTFFENETSMAGSGQDGDAKADGEEVNKSGLEEHATGTETSR